ncbi:MULTISPECIES: peptide MFS transporter [Sphingobacterium]|uniref:peptide MFS transporter n=1 Tax=Sphingobacterium TaxID=28453 RepID=UPI000B93BEFF|nr:MULTISPECIES: peptide MFS transporter [Sphingobacterium]OYD42599.1 MFS transporter [Sphingobacterium cellulitidis]OYD45210.1 MFS transporter [Sphingobacterium cellulitidis]WFB61916.1 peptide MFS transporter [Sphingobacterium sp. WM]
MSKSTDASFSAELEKQGLDGNLVLGHPSGLFVLFFTEMWERFSFYGMRVLLINFLTSAIISGSPFSGWGWDPVQAGALYGTYAMLLYISPIFGGILADKYLGYRYAIVIGAAIMTLGHLFMAFDTPLFLYLGLGALVLGTGFFKPNMTSILSEMYKKFPQKKDAAYTIFYMGVNSGAFFGMMLCGYLGEKVGWHWGFGLAGIFMFLGTLQFWFAKPIFGTVGDPPTAEQKEAKAEAMRAENPDDKPNPFTGLDIILIVIMTILGLGYAFNDPLSKISGIDILSSLQIGSMAGQNVAIIAALILFLFVVISRLTRYTKVVRDRLIAVIIFAFFVIFFWMSFEQGASSLVIFARDSVDRSLSGDSLMAFNVINSLLTVVPLLFVTYAVAMLTKKTFGKAPLSNLVQMLCFGGIWGIALWMLYKEFTAESSEIAVSWFSIMNSFFIITFANFVSKIWDSKYNPPATVKYGMGLIIMAIGFGLLAFGANGLQAGVKVSMVWLILAYMFHTLGELCLSPVGLSYVSKLAPARMIGFMFGMWYLALAIGNKLAAILGGQIDNITKEYSLSTFFLIFTIVPIAAGLLVMLLNPVVKKLMHGVK